MTPAGTPGDHQSDRLPSHRSPFDGDDGSNVLSWTCQGCAGAGCSACGFTGEARRNPGKTITNLLVRRNRPKGYVDRVCSTDWCGKPYSVKEDDDSHGGLCGLCRDRIRRSRG